MKKLMCILAIVVILLAATGCQKTKVLHCDHCGKEVTVKASSNMEESWTVYCEKCNEELFADDPLLGNS